MLVVTLDNTVLNVALPSIAADLHAGTSELQWIVNAYSLLPAAAVALLLARAFVPADAEHTGGRADLTGTALSIVAMAAFVAALVDGSDHGWGSAAVVVPALAAVAAGAGFAWWELRAPQPMVDVRALARGAVAGPAAAQGASMFAAAGVLFLLTQQLQIVAGYSPIEAGLRTAPVALGLMLSGPLLTQGAQRLGTARTASLGLVLSAAAVAGLGVGVAHGYWPLAGGLFALGAGLRIVVTTAALAVLDGLPHEAAGVGAALGDTFQEVGGALGVALLGSIFNAVYRSGLPDAAPGAARASVQGALGLHDAALAGAARHAFASGAQAALLACAAILAAAAVVARRTVRDGCDLAAA
jgi:hypothetical protein